MENGHEGNYFNLPLDNAEIYKRSAIYLSSVSEYSDRRDRELASGVSLAYGVLPLLAGVFQVFPELRKLAQLCLSLLPGVFSLDSESSANPLSGFCAGSAHEF